MTICQQHSDCAIRHFGITRDHEVCVISHVQPGDIEKVSSKVIAGRAHEQRRIID
jgi:hypothetical protein